jgi:prevent-host-death family protein
MKSYATRKAKTHFAEIIRESSDWPVEITRHGRRVAYVISPRDYREYMQFRKIVLDECIAAALIRAVELFKAGDSARGHGVFRALAPYWRAAGVAKAPPLRADFDRETIRLHPDDLRPAGRRSLRKAERRQERNVAAADERLGEARERHGERH